MAHDILWHLLTGTRGGPTRARILFAIQHLPKHALRLANDLHLDHSTVQHHLAILTSHQIVEPLPGTGRYGQAFRLTAGTKAVWDEFAPVWEDVQRSGKTADAVRANSGKAS
jgi:predicted ArsR family transcriptional regulator